ncbi:hypothetical protein QK360_11325 [Pseudomonas aeruginosa]|uniref:hypothetical protein n=1 Tax=Pseudomonas aeruginosa TaxID=287 RepID=UPI00033EA8CB|nr:hypothetical protein [Pseudomonas aeruginosa]ARI05607.1 hypothetical protein Y880_0589001 [Pseudomonas aeruginosa PAK]EOT25230.1 hypothetical protein PAK_00471 [Pseudomonas aeruginosa PAK]MBG4227194.1 hypothetical protein [Pseudomonas aeruginosa]MBG4238878.1 hypothetical protein [Pseudomonas aeruginosa]MBH3596984.1 hypothetical protein [Pseudomonas aeruginosa]
MVGHFKISDITFDEVAETQYDLAIFACGYEERSIYFPGLLDPKTFKKSIVFGFASSLSDDAYVLNQEFYKSKLKVIPTPVDQYDLGKIFSILSEEFKDIPAGGDSKFRMLVDYSSMPRLWYSEILNFIKIYELDIPVLLDFVYSVGEHSASKYEKQLSDPVVLPGCEAISAYNRETIGIFSLGFSDGGPICLHRKIEPDRSFSLVARPGALEDYTEKTLNINKFFLDNVSQGTVFSPLNSVQQCYETIREIFYPFKESAITVIVPFGPKPHALASIIASMNFPEVTCLYSSLGSTGSQVKPTTELVLSRIEKETTEPLADPY